MRWRNAGSHEVVSMLGLASRVGTTTERSPASLVPLSVTMDGLHVLQARPEALLAVQTVHVANIGEPARSKEHRTFSAAI